MEKTKSALYVSVGRELTHYDIDVARAELTKRATIELPQNLQYAWPHSSREYLYGACSNGSPEVEGNAHCAVALDIDPHSRALRAHGPEVPLPSRPIHVTIDGGGAHMLTVYNKPSSITIHRIDREGSIGAVVRQAGDLDTGIYAHQVKLAPSNRSVVVVARGNDARGDRAEDPGALKVFRFADGQLAPSQSVAPNGGYGVGPRHIDFHPSRPWVYASLERQNTLQMYRFENDAMEETPAYTKATLADPTAERRRQRCGTIHVHPNGRYVYVANRASGADEQGMYIGGENNIAVYRIDAQTGEPTAVQHADTHGIVPRTFALDPSGKLLVAANSIAIRTPEGTISPSLAVFKVADDGTLEYVRKYDVDIGKETMFWMGIV